MGFNPFSALQDTIFGAPSQPSTTAGQTQNQRDQLGADALADFAKFRDANTDRGFDAANQLSAQGQGFLNTLQGGGGHFGPGNQLNQFTGPGNVNQQVESLTDILNRNLSFNLQNIGQQSALGNTFGGGRQGVTAGTAIGDTQLALGQGVSDIFRNDRQQQLQAATSQFQGGLFAGQQNQQANLQGALGGLSQLGGQFDLRQSGFQNVFQPGINTAGILGNPISLQGQGSRPGLISALGSFI